MTQDQLVVFPSIDYIQGEHFDIEKLAFFYCFCCCVKHMVKSRRRACFFVPTLFFVPVANKWIHEYGQEFRHGCSLNPEE